jgi:hypothetical protein
MLPLTTQGAIQMTHSLLLDDALATVVEEMIKAMQCDRATCYILDHDKNELWSRVAKGTHATIRLPVGHGIAGWSILYEEVRLYLRKRSLTSATPTWTLDSIPVWITGPITRLNLWLRAPSSRAIDVLACCSVSTRRGVAFNHRVFLRKMSSWSRSFQSSAPRP